ADRVLGHHAGEKQPPEDEGNRRGQPERETIKATGPAGSRVFVPHRYILSRLLAGAKKSIERKEKSRHDGARGRGPASRPGGSRRGAVPPGARRPLGRGRPRAPRLLRFGRRLPPTPRARLWLPGAAGLEGAGDRLRGGGPARRPAPRHR